MEVSKDIEDALQKCGIRRDIDVCQISLIKKRLTSVPDLSRFHFLRKLWLNNNQIRGLEDTTHELRKMHQLQTAKVKSAERRTSFQTHSQDRHRILQSVAFGRRAS
ncbi:hypothetical protein PAMP_002636 [Pampus punctatissimus]